MNDRPEIDDKLLGDKLLDETNLVRDLQKIRNGASACKQWAPALRAVELLGKYIGMWKSKAQPRTSLADLINRAAASLADSGAAH
jgi:hypothetical protein